ncbi:hypothetical protein P7C71_g6569, partial [Lecanoromycetidae sp. Uapishka_2]
MEPSTFRRRDGSNSDPEKAMNTLGVDRLSRFRELVGIHNVNEVGPHTTSRPARNIGIYNRVTTEERTAKYQYYLTAFLINACLLLQVTFASALTALGAGNGSHTQITALGAANTVIAAILTFTKGQGLPNKLRQYQQTLRKVREYIEQRERDFAQLDCKLDLDHELKIIKELYEEARQNDENNDPSSYHNATTPPKSERPLTAPARQDHSNTAVSQLNSMDPKAKDSLESQKTAKEAADSRESSTERASHVNHLLQLHQETRTTQTARPKRPAQLPEEAAALQAALAPALLDNSNNDKVVQTPKTSPQTTVLQVQTPQHHDGLPQIPPVHRDIHLANPRPRRIIKARRVAAHLREGPQINPLHLENPIAARNVVVDAHPDLEATDMVPNHQPRPLTRPVLTSRTTTARKQ